MTEIQQLKEQMTTLQKDVQELQIKQSQLIATVEKLDNQIQQIVDIQQRMMEWVKNK